MAIYTLAGSARYIFLPWRMDFACSFSAVEKNNFTKVKAGRWQQQLAVRNEGKGYKKKQQLASMPALLAR